MCFDAPDYTPVSDASEHAASLSYWLGQDQLNHQRGMYQDMSPRIKQVMDTQISSMEEQTRQAQDYYNYNRDTYRPLEQWLVRDAENFNTAAYRDQLASQAAADAGLAFSRTNQANERAMRSMGVNPNSGAARSVAAQSALGLAANRANTMTNTRRTAEQTGWARRLDAAGLGRNLPGASTAAYQGAATAGGTAAGAGTNFMNANTAGYNAGTNTIMQGQQMAIQGLSGVLNSQAQYAAGSMQGLGSAVGIGAGLAIASDRRLKENVQHVGHDARTGLNIYQFNYIGGEQRFEGVMADEVYAKYPSAVSFDSNNFMRVNYIELGLEMREVA